MGFSLNYWAMGVAVIVLVFIGRLWYGLLFGKMWARYEGLSEDYLETTKFSAPSVYLFGFGMPLLIVLGVAWVMEITGISLWASAGWQLVFSLWLGFVVPVVGGAVFWLQKPFSLFVLNASYYLISIFSVFALLSIWK